MFTFWFMLCLLALITTFGIGTAVNMIVRRWWVTIVLYGLFSVYLLASFAGRMTFAEWVLYTVGLVGAILSTFGVRTLKKRGYALFGG